jgi:hypothetical protein
MQVLYRLSYVGSGLLPELLPAQLRNRHRPRSLRLPGAAVAILTKLLERETGFEPATLSLEG